MVNIIIHSGTKRERLEKRKDSLAGLLGKDIRKGDGGPKGTVYDFEAWKDEKKKGLGKHSNKALVSEAHDIQKEMKKKYG